MPFDIPLSKPVGRRLESNRVWLEPLRTDFPALQEEPRDHARAAEELAVDIGLMPNQYVARGIGLALEREEPWLRVSFWDESALIELDSFPEEGAGAALRNILPVIEALQSLGFVLLDPSTGEPIQGEVLDVLEAAYSERQGAVASVGRITG